MNGTTFDDIMDVHPILNLSLMIEIPPLQFQSNIPFLANEFLASKQKNTISTFTINNSNASQHSRHPKGATARPLQCNKSS